MSARAGRIVWLVVALGAAAPHATRADWIDGDVKVYMRAGGGLEYRILRALSSGDAVTRLGGDGEWTRIRAGDGLEGYVESAYVTRELPAKLEVPQARERVAAAEKRVIDLEEKLAAQAGALAELESARARTLELETEHARLAGGARWRELLAGAGIVVAGMLIGAVLPKGGAARARKIKL